MINCVVAASSCSASHRSTLLRSAIVLDGHASVGGGSAEGEIAGQIARSVLASCFQNRSADLSRWATLHTSASGYFARSTEQMAAWRRSMRYLPHGVDVVPAACGLHVSTSVVKVSNNLNPADPATISDVSES